MKLNELFHFWQNVWKIDWLKAQQNVCTWSRSDQLFHSSLVFTGLLQLSHLLSWIISALFHSNNFSCLLFFHPPTGLDLCALQANECDYLIKSINMPPPFYSSKCEEKDANSKENMYISNKERSVVLLIDWGREQNAVSLDNYT